MRKKCMPNDKAAVLSPYSHYAKKPSIFFFFFFFFWTSFRSDPEKLNDHNVHQHQTIMRYAWFFNRSMSNTLAHYRSITIVGMLPQTPVRCCSLLPLLLLVVDLSEYRRDLEALNKQTNKQANRHLSNRPSALSPSTDSHTASVALPPFNSALLLVLNIPSRFITFVYVFFTSTWFRLVAQKAWQKND